MTLSRLQQALLNDYQRDFPIIPQPYHDIAAHHATTPATVKNTLSHLKDAGVISRIGPVFRPNAIGASTLAAMSVPPERLRQVADHVNSYAQITHNYERENVFNLWFVVNAPNSRQRDGVISRIEAQTSIPVIALPLVRPYHIDLGFDIDFTGVTLSSLSRTTASRQQAASTQEHAPGDLVAALQAGLPITDSPYHALAQQIELSEADVIEQIESLVRDETIKRFGIIVRHHELGYLANAMCVWDIPDSRVDALGAALAESPRVTLCYRRERRLPQWRFNLYCMIHGKNRQSVLGDVAGLIDQHELGRFAHDVLFSRQRFKQRGPCYRATSSFDAMTSAQHG